MLLALAGVLWSLAHPSQVTPDVVRVTRGDAVAMEYRYGVVPFKPYVMELRTPRAVNVLRDSVADHAHHHGLMLALTVNGVNFWEETAGCGTQRTDRVRGTGAGIWSELAWLAPAPTLTAPGAAATLLDEDRSVEVVETPDRSATVLAWRSRLTAPRRGGAPTALTGAHYHGLGARFVAAMDGGTFVTESGDAGTVVRGEERLSRGRWCAYTAQVDGQPVTVAMFDHPGNPRPVTWFTMPRPFGYLAATMRLHEEPLSVAPGKHITLRYGVAAWDGKPDPGRIETVYKAWLRRAGKG